MNVGRLTALAVQLVHLLRETVKLRSPPKKFFGRFQAVLEHCLRGPDAALHTGTREDWAMLHDLDLPDVWARNSAEYQWGEFLLVSWDCRWYRPDN
jgi:hypothetical protein